MTAPTTSDTDALFDRLPVAVFRTTPSGRVLAANPAMCELLGYSLDELLEIDVVDLYADRRARTAIVQEVADLGTSTIEVAVIRSDGTPIWVRVRARAVFDRGELSFLEGTIEDVSARRHAEEALRESEMLFRLAFERAPQGLVLHNPDGVPVKVNDAMCRLVGLPMSEIVGAPPHHFVHPDERANAEHRLERLRSGELDSYEVERRIVAGDGSIRHVLIGGAAIRRHGEYHGFLTQIVDLTARRRAEMRLETSEALFRSTFDNAPIGMAITSADGRRLQGNPALCSILHTTPEAFTAASFTDHLCPEDAADAADRLERMRAGTLDSYTVERRLVRPSGEVRWVQFFVSPVRDETGTLQSVLTQVEDTTERREVMEALHRREAENRALIAAIPDMLFTLDREGTFLTFKPAATFGPVIEPAAFLGKRLADVFPAREPEVLPAIHAALDEQQSQYLDIELNVGRPGMFEAIVGPLGPNEVIMVVRDITDRVAAKTQLEALLRSKDDLIASVSHELRTPLTTVVGLASEITERFDEFSEEERRGFVQMIANEGSEMADLIDDLLVAARADVGMVRLEPSEIDVRSEIEGTIAVWQGPPPRIAGSGDTRAWADPFRVRQIMRNLLTNAMRYGEPPIEVRITGRDALRSVEVVDSGPGLAEDRWEKIFDPYYTAHEHPGIPASVGLGLTVSRRLARLMGGDLTYGVESGASVFTLTLPVTEPQTPDTAVL